MIIMRCAASVEQGMGHLIRTRALAAAFVDAGHECIIVGPPEACFIESDKTLFNHRIVRKQWDDTHEEARFHINLARRTGARHIVLDDYRSNTEHQLALRNAELCLLQQYDASKPQRFAAQFPINSSPSEDASLYADDFCAPDITMLTGPDYCVLRDQFMQSDVRNTQKQKRILVMFGGGSDRGAILITLKALRGNIPCDYTVTVVVGALHPDPQSISDFIDKYDIKNIELLQNPDDIACIIASCRFMITAGGTATFEAAYCGTPMVLLPIASNQYKQGQGWEKLGAAVYLGPVNDVDPESIRQTCMRMIQDDTAIAAAKKAAQCAVDGKGKERIITAFLAFS